MDDDFLVDCALYGISPLSPIVSDPSSAFSVSEFPDTGLLPFTASSFIDLLDSLKIPFIENTGNQVLSSTNIAGEGGFAVVTHDKFMGAEGSGEIAIAIKEFKSAPTVSDKVERASRMSADFINQAFIEVSIMKHPFLETHPNILQLIGVTDNSGFVFSTIPFQFCLVTEFANLGPLESYIARHHQKMSIECKGEIMFGVVAGLEALHSCDIIHNDIKPGNILLFSEDAFHAKITAKISDFGCSVPLCTKRTVRRGAGTRTFASPEAYSPRCIVNRSRDTYSLGIVFLHLVPEFPAFTGLDEDHQLQVKENPDRLRKYIQEFLDMSAWADNSDVMGLLNGLMNPEPSKRLTDMTAIKAGMSVVFSIKASNSLEQTYRLL